MNGKILSFIFLQELIGHLDPQEIKYTPLTSRYFYNQRKRKLKEWEDYLIYILK